MRYGTIVETNNEERLLKYLALRIHETNIWANLVIKQLDESYSSISRDFTHLNFLYTVQNY